MLRFPGGSARVFVLAILAVASSLAACSSVAEGPAAPARAPDPVCPAGSAWDGHQCVRTLVVTEVVCPPGSTWDGARCAGQLGADCPAGMAFVAGHGCVADADFGQAAAAPQPAPTATGESGVVGWSSPKSPAAPPPGVLPPQPARPRCSCAPNDLMCAMNCANVCKDQPLSCYSASPPAPAPPPASAPPPAGTKPFDRGAAVTALTAAAQSAKGCAKPGVAGVARVRVVFGPTGAVTTATVEPGDFQGTPEGGCIAAAFRNARVPAFDGAPVTVTKSVAIP